MYYLKKLLGKALRLNICIPKLNMRGTAVDTCLGKFFELESWNELLEENEITKYKSFPHQKYLFSLSSVLRPGFKTTFIQGNSLWDSVLNSQNMLIHLVLLKETIFSSTLWMILRSLLLCFRIQIICIVCIPHYCLTNSTKIFCPQRTIFV